MEKNVSDALVRSFTITLAAFEFQHAVLMALGQPYKPSLMEHLHRKMLALLRQEPIDDNAVDELLKEMETLASQNVVHTVKFDYDNIKSYSPKGFASGGLVPGVKIEGEEVILRPGEHFFSEWKRPVIPPPDPK